MSNEAHYDVVNVGSNRLATDGECIRDAFVKINNNHSTVFNTVLDYDLDVQFGGWKLVVGVDNSIVISNSINVSNNVGVNVVNMVTATNNLDLDFNVTNSLNLNVANNIDVSINNSGITLISDVSNNVVLTANSFTSSNVIYAPSLTNTTNTNNITFNSNDIDITNTFGDINIDSDVNLVNIIGGFTVNTTALTVNISTGDVSIYNALTVDNSNNINIGINNTIAIDNSQNITFAPSTNIDFTNIVNMDLDINLINQIDIDFESITNNSVLVYNSNSETFEPGTVSQSLNDLSDVISDPNSDGQILIYNQQGGTWVNGRPELNNFAMTNRNIIPTQNHGIGEQEEFGFTVGSSEFRYSAMFANRFNGDLEGSVFADDSSMIIDGTDGRVVGDVENNSVITGRVKSQDDIDLYVFAGGTGSVILAGQSDVSIGHTSGQVDIYGDVEFNNGTTAFQSGNDVSFNCPVKFTQSAPASSIGADTDLQGAVAFDSNYIYYCTADYDGVTNIWKRVAWSGDTW